LGWKYHIVATTRDRLIDVAFRLFTDQGFEQTTVEQLAREGGVSRATFFRMFATKEAVIFPDHDTLLAAVDARLSAADAGSAMPALHEAIRLVLRHYIAEGATARARFALTHAVPALRESELTSTLRYVRLIRGHVQRWRPADPSASAFERVQADLIANVVVAVHNRTLLDWLRQVDDTPEASLDAALHEALDRLWSDPVPATQVVVLRTDRDLTTLMPELKRLVGGAE
jgi:AcrR family transcriptional regulator